MRYNLRQPGFEILPVFVFLSGSVDTAKVQHNMLRLPATKSFYEAATDCQIDKDKSTGYLRLRDNDDPSSDKCARFIIARDDEEIKTGVKHLANTLRGHLKASSN